jgi:hypothetical protein
MNVTKEELGKALQTVGEQMHELEKTVSRIAIDLTSLQWIVATLIEPNDPKRGLARIEEISAAVAKRDPTAPARKRIDEAIEMLKLIEKHGPPRES